MAERVFNIFLYTSGEVSKGEQAVFRWVLIPAVIILIISILGFMLYSYISSRLRLGLKGLRNELADKYASNKEALFKDLKHTGFAYDPAQDIFYSVLEAWQRKFGYCRLYDEAAVPMGMVIDCEPVYFNYNNKRWLIQFWKGQYDLTLGAEIGVYNTTGPQLRIPGFFNGTFYRAATDEELLYMSFILRKNGEPVFIRKGLHWWLTGFKLGEFAEPHELTMDISITLLDYEMRDAFVQAAKKTGYTDDDIYINGRTVSLVFDKPKTPQPLSRKFEWIVQRKNEYLCKKFRQLTEPADSTEEKINILKKKPRRFTAD